MAANETRRGREPRIIDFQLFVRRRNREALPLFEGPRTTADQFPSPARSLDNAQVAHRERMLRFLGSR